MCDVCRLCLTDIPEINKPTYDYYTSYNAKLKLIMPEIDIATTTTFILCKQCSESLNSAYNFKRRCLDIEKLITNYLREINATVINLKYLQSQHFKDDVYLTDSTIQIKDSCDNSEDISEIESFDADVEPACNESNNIFYNVDVNNGNTIEVCETKIYCESIKNREPKEYSQTFKCNICNKILSHRYLLARHQLVHNERDFICQLCKKGFKTKYDLKRHGETHARSKMHKCPTCLKFVRDVKKHTNSRHLNKHICHVCGAKFAFNSNLIDHIRIHTGDRPYRCEMCGKGFAQKSTLYIHIKGVHTKDKRHVCETCAKGFTKPVELRKHELVHVPNREKKFVCEAVGCNKAFTTKQRRHDHMKRHSPEKKYKCAICDKAFFDNHDLKRHLKIHTGEKPFECSICCKSFGQNGNLRIHMKSHRPKSS